MRIKYFSLISVLLLSLATCAMAPARAEYAPMDGVYYYHDADGASGKWTIATTCAPECVAHVTTSSGRGFDAFMVDGRYTNTRTIPDGVTCPGHTAGDFGRWIPASTHPITVTQWWDPVTLTGEVDFLNHTAPCQIADHYDRFTLVKVG